MAEYNGLYVPQTEFGILSKPLTDLHDSRTMELTYNYVLTKYEHIYGSVSFTLTKQSWWRSIQEIIVNVTLGLTKDNIIQVA